MMQGDPRWSQIREYLCPGCMTQLEVEAVPPGYPVVHDFVPDIDGFYQEWLRRPVPTAS
jgi:acetone carboxylase gamma subunit